MKNYIAYLLFGLTILILTAFELPHQNLSIDLVDLNNEIKVKSFEIDQAKIVLNENDKETFYVLIKKDNISGKKLVNHEKVSRKGKRVKLAFFIESKTSGKKLFKGQTSFMHWTDGDVFTPYLTQPLHVGNYSFKVNVVNNK